MEVIEKSSEKLTKKSSPRAVTSVKVVVRHLPPSLTEDSFLEQVAPLPTHDYFAFERADPSLGLNGFTRAYISFTEEEDLYIFKEKFDGYVFVDAKGFEFPAVVELAPFQKVPRNKTRKGDARKGTLEKDPEYMKFLAIYNNIETDGDSAPLTVEEVLDEIEAKQRALQENNGRQTTHLIDFLKRRKEEKKQLKEDRRKKEEDRRKRREEERRKRREAVASKNERTASTTSRHATDHDDAALQGGDGGGHELTSRSFQLLKKQEGSDSHRDKKSARGGHASKSESRFEFRKPSQTAIEKDDTGSKTKDETFKKNRGKPGSSSETSERAAKDEQKHEKSRFSYKDNRRSAARDADDSSEKLRRASAAAEKERAREERLKREQLKQQGRERRERLNMQASSSKSETPPPSDEPSSKGAVRDEENIATSDDSALAKTSSSRPRYKDRPERQIYNPAQRAAERKKQQLKQRDSESSSSKASTPDDSC